MANLQAQGVHHLTMVGSNREATIEFYEGVLGMPFIFEQPNLDVPEENHLYFDIGDGRLLTFFVRPTRTNDPTPNPEGIGNLHHLAFNVSRATYTQVAARLEELGITNTGPIDRGFMDSIYFRDPNGQLLELACYKFEPPVGYTHSDVLTAAHNIRVAAGDYNIEDKHLADAIIKLTAERAPKMEAGAALAGAGGIAKRDGARDGHEQESRM
jgi:catechol 2,3-dioxygenase-like lactoylglutathione lyase family enzyme